jgi:hypothetical protein
VTRPGLFLHAFSNAVSELRGKIMKIRFFRHFLTVLVVFCVSFSLFSQNPPATRDDQALKILEVAIGSLGAANSVNTVHTMG